MLSYKQITKITKMFIGINEPFVDKNLYDDIDLEDDFQWNYTLMNVPPAEFFLSNSDQFDAIKTVESPISAKAQIRHHDCMWSGRCTTHPEKQQCNAAKSPPHSDNNNSNNAKSIGGAQQNETVPPTPQVPQHKKNSQDPIPAGRSLLINSRLNQPKTPVLKLPTVTTNDFLKDREFVNRPDTPLSLDDDPPEFKHSIDLAACTMGSNKMSLVTDNETPTEIINMLKEQLEDQSTNQMQIKSRFHTFLPDSKNESLTELLKDIKCLSDFEEVEDDDSGEDMDSDDDSSSVENNNTKSASSSQNLHTMHSDHSYTRSKTRVDVIGLGVQTPSDSEEEIDVVSVGDKTLPTNPTAKDRRALQTTVADKISRIDKPTGGIKTLLPRRRYSVEFESSCTTPFVKTNTSNTTNAMPSSMYMDVPNSRKRPHHFSSTTKEDRNTNVKRFKGKKHRPSPTSRRNTATSDTDETDTIEKRNLHNDMERQRRIGLKNLFEELKYQIPSLRDKDRAPKVSILREAANMCRKFVRDEEQENALKKIQAKLYNRVSVLRTSVAAQRTKFMN